MLEPNPAWGSDTGAHVSLHRPCGMKAAGSGNTNTLSLNLSDFACSSFFCLYFTAWMCKNSIYNCMHTYTHRHTNTLVSLYHRYINTFLSQLWIEPRGFIPSCAQCRTKRSSSLSFTQHQFESTYTYTHTLWRVRQIKRYKLFTLPVSWCLHTQTHTHFSEALALWGKLNLSLIAEDRRVFIQTYTHTNTHIDTPTQS